MAEFECLDVIPCPGLRLRTIACASVFGRAGVVITPGKFEKPVRHVTKLKRVKGAFRKSERHGDSILRFIMARCSKVTQYCGVKKMIKMARVKSSYGGCADASPKLRVLENK
jgi:hypothetical protein